MVPELDGVQLLHTLRVAGDKTSIQMLTARDAIEDRAQALERDADVDLWSLSLSLSLSAGSTPCCAGREQYGRKSPFPSPGSSWTLILA
jgi:CheY-like chemotaxis protein